MVEVLVNERLICLVKSDLTVMNDVPTYLLKYQGGWTINPHPH